MIFLVALLFLTCLHMYGSLRSLSRRQLGWTMAHMLAASAFAYGGLWGMVTRMNLIPVRLDGVNWSVWGFLAGGLLTLLLATVRLVHLPASGPGLHSAAQRAGWTAALITGTYMCFAVGDHLWFFRDASQTGVGYVSVFERSGRIDISCPQDLVLANVISEPAKYRCPSLVLFGAPLGEPFAPWPTYSSGESEQLTTALTRLGFRPN